MVPAGFARVCTESRVSLGLVIGLLGVAVVGCVVAGLSWGVERKIERLRGEREVMASRDGNGVEMTVPVYVEKQDLERV